MSTNERLQQEAQALLELALRARPAVLHTTSRPGNGLVTRAVAEALGIPWVYEVRELPADRWAASRPAEAVTSERHRLDCAREAEVLAAAADVVTTSRAMGERVRALTRALPAGPVPVGWKVTDPDVRAAPSTVTVPVTDPPLPQPGTNRQRATAAAAARMRFHTLGLRSG